MKYKIFHGALYFEFDQIRDLYQYLHYMNIDQNEIDFGIEELIKQGHDTVHYGIKNTFMFTDKSIDLMCH